jgi:hypothetical protein
VDRSARAALDGVVYAWNDPGGAARTIGNSLQHTKDTITDYTVGWFFEHQRAENLTRIGNTYDAAQRRFEQLKDASVYDQSRAIGDIVGTGAQFFAPATRFRRVPRQTSQFAPPAVNKNVGRSNIPLSEAPFDYAYRARLGVASSDDYRSTFFSAYPELEGNVVVHHAVEQQVLNRFPNVVTKTEIHSLENLRGIPVERNTELHLTKIRKEWSDFYRHNPTPTKQELLLKATQIDFKFGKEFTPPVGRVGQ